MSQQLTLFDSQPAQVTPPATRARSRKMSLPEWSHSRRSTFERCLLWYYRLYYGARKGTAHAEQHKDLLRFLKTLSNFNLRAGEILHFVIRTYLRRLKEGDAWTLERVLSWSQEIYEHDFEFSRNYTHGTPLPTDDNAPVLLSEFYYGSLEAESEWRQSAARLRDALTNFITNPNFEQFRLGAMHPASLIEKTVRVKEESFRLRGQIDLAYPEGERNIIVDWKIGESNGEGSESLQLLSYALAAVNELHCAPESIELYKVHLGDSVVSPCTPTGNDIRKARARVIQDTERMQAMDEYGRNAVAEAFTPCEQYRVCQMCPFKALCPQYQQELN